MTTKITYFDQYGRAVGFSEGSTQPHLESAGCTPKPGEWAESDWHLKSGAIVPRPEFQTTSSGSVAIGQTWRIDGIPPGTFVVFPNGATIVDDGFIEWSATEPGQYVFSLSNFPYKEVQIIAEITDL